MTTDTLLSPAAPRMPSLYSAEHMPPQQAPRAPGTFVDMLHDGFYLLLLLKNRYAPASAEHFLEQIRRLLADFDRSAQRSHALPEDVHAAKYAFCATVDEIILSSDMAIRGAWERAPLQLTLFGDQLAGENFYHELDRIRQRGQGSVAALEVFYMCLLIGFQGKYALEGPEKLNYLKASLDKEITHLKGKRAQFAPHWKSPDNIRHAIKADVPIWVIVAAFACVGLATFAGLNWLLAQHTNAVLGNYFDVIGLTTKLAHITVSLP